jgi:surfeit locus 1 family protein
MKRRVWPVLLAAAIAFAMLMALGVWQVQRLAWKQGLIAAIDQAMRAEPVPLDEAIAQLLAGKSINFAKVKAKGSFVQSEPLRLLSSSEEGPSWTLVQGFQQPNGTAVLVNRGKVGQDRQLPPAPLDSVEIVGHVHLHDQGKGFFDVENNREQNQWYWWDVAAMSKAVWATQSNPNLIVIDPLPDTPGTEGLVVDPPKANLRNNHLGYAITWFGLAAVLVVMTGLFARGIVRTR